MRPTDARGPTMRSRMPLPLQMATVAALSGAVAGCPGKSPQEDRPSTGQGSPGGPSKPDPRSAYHARAVDDGRGIEVRVRYTGAARPGAWDIPPMVRSQCGGTARAADEALLVSADGGLDDAVVWIDDIHEGVPLATGASAPAYEQDEKACSFAPHVLAMPASGTLKLANSDPANHAVRFEFKGEGTDESEDFTKTLPPGSTYGIEVKPDWAGHYARVTCPIHLWMSSYVHFFDHPYFAVTKGGVARLEKVPPGHYHVQVWHEGIGVTFASSLKFPPPETARAEVTVGSADVKVAFTMGADGKLASAGP